MFANEDYRRKVRTALAASAGLNLVYVLAALLCLRQWSGPDPWARLDLFSGSVLAAGLAYGLQQTFGFTRTVLRSHEVLREAVGISYDPRLHTWAAALALAELSAYLDYAHWRLAPALEQPALQAAGLGLYLLAFGWMLWTDRHLVAHFAGELENRRLVTAGPYRRVRHPRYLGVLLSRAAFALLLASVLGWLCVLGWLAAIIRRIRREETHMLNTFGAEYAAYQKCTARLLPGIF